MTTNAASANPWLAVVLRLTAFPRDPGDIGNDLSWEELVGEAPESVEEQPRVKTTVSKGDFALGELIHARHVDRIELVYGAKLDESVIASGGFLNIGPFEAALVDFEPLMTKWIEGLPAIQRLGFGAILRLPVNSHDEAYGRLDSLLPSVNVEPGTTDFLYQINRPRLSVVKKDLVIHRLMKWVAIRSSFVTGVGASASEKFGCQLELDVNTHQSFDGEFSKEEIQSISKELVALAIEIKQKGEIA